MSLRNLTSKLAIFALVFATFALAQRGPSDKGPMPNYDKKAEMVLNGIVKDVQLHTHAAKGGGTMSGTHLVFEAAGKTYEVHVGPNDFLDANKYTFAKGDKLEITGAPSTLDGQPIFVARLIKKGDTLMKLRHENGKPMWSGKGRKR